MAMDNLNTSFPNKFHEILNLPGNKISLEISSKKDLDLNLLSQLKPLFCSVTWRIKSQRDCVDNVANSDPLVVAEKLSRKGYFVILNIPGKHFSKTQVLEILNKSKSVGVRGIFAIQGDLPYSKDEEKTDFKYASDLISFIKRHFGNYFCIGIAGYPEKQPNVKSVEEDVERLKNKVIHGADFIITQGCFNHHLYKRFVETCRSCGITIPIFCGVFLPNIFFYGRLNGITYPEEMLDKKCNGGDLGIERISFIFIKDIIKYLLNGNIPDGIHLFSMNDLDLCKKMYSALQLSTN